VQYSAIGVHSSLTRIRTDSQTLMIETDTNVEHSTAVERQHCSHSGGPEHLGGAHNAENPAQTDSRPRGQAGDLVPPLVEHPEEWLTPLVPYARVNWKAIKRLG
jgi:hypothetical protein